MVGARVDILTRIACALIAALIGGVLASVIAIDGAEVACIEAQLFGNVPSATKTYTVTVAGKRGVLLVVVRETIVGTLTTTADSKLVIDVPLDASEEFVGTVLERLLAIASHLGVGVVELVILEGRTEAGGKVVTSSNDKQCWHIVTRLGAIGIGGSKIA